MIKTPDRSRRRCTVSIAASMPWAIGRSRSSAAGWRRCSRLGRRRCSVIARPASSGGSSRVADRAGSDSARAMQRAKPRIVVHHGSLSRGRGGAGAGDTGDLGAADDARPGGDPAGAGGGAGLERDGSARLQRSLSVPDLLRAPSAAARGRCSSPAWRPQDPAGRDHPQRLRGGLPRPDRPPRPASAPDERPRRRCAVASTKSTASGRSSGSRSSSTAAPPTRPPRPSTTTANATASSPPKASPPPASPGTTSDDRPTESPRPARSILTPYPCPMDRELFDHFLHDESRRGPSPDDAFTGAAGGAACGDLSRLSLTVEAAASPRSPSTPRDAAPPAPPPRRSPKPSRAPRPRGRPPSRSTTPKPFSAASTSPSATPPNSPPTPSTAP